MRIVPAAPGLQIMPDDKSSSHRQWVEAAFAATRWSVVLEAGRQDSPRAAEALAELCRTYWYPL
jgi:hypothetical protein